MQAVELHGADSVSWEGVPEDGLQVTPGGVRPWRLPVDDLDLFLPTKGLAHHEASSNGILTQAANASGVRIVLSSDTVSLRLVVRPRFVYSGTDFDLVADGKLIGNRRFAPEVVPALPEGVEAGTPAAMMAMMAQMAEAADEVAEPVVVEFSDISAAGGGSRTLELWLPHRSTITVLSLEVAAG